MTSSEVSRISERRNDDEGDKKLKLSIKLERRSCKLTVAVCRGLYLGTWLEISRQFWC